MGPPAPSGRAGPARRRGASARSVAAVLTRRRTRGPDSCSSPVIGFPCILCIGRRPARSGPWLGGSRFDRVFSARRRGAQPSTRRSRRGPVGLFRMGHDLLREFEGFGRFLDGWVRVPGVDPARVVVSRSLDRFGVDVGQGRPGGPGLGGQPCRVLPGVGPAARIYDAGRQREIDRLPGGPGDRRRRGVEERVLRVEVSSPPLGALQLCGGPAPWPNSSSRAVSRSSVRWTAGGRDRGA